MLSDIEEAKHLFVAAQFDPDQKLTFKKVANRILKAIHFGSAFSGEMRFLLGGERDAAHSWIQNLLET